MALQNIKTMIEISKIDAHMFEEGLRLIVIGDKAIDTLTQTNWKEQINFSLYFSMRWRTPLAEGMGDHYYIITQLLTHELALHIELNKWTLT